MGTLPLLILTSPHGDISEDAVVFFRGEGDAISSGRRIRRARPQLD